jgi:hypothetical protein
MDALLLHARVNGRLDMTAVGASALSYPHKHIVEGLALNTGDLIDKKTE